LGAVAWGAGQHDLALQYYREAVRLQPEYFDGQFALGSALADSRDFAAAAPHLRAAARLRPDSREALFRCAAVMTALEQPKEAIVFFRQLIHLDPANPEHYINLGGTLWAMGNIPEALGAYAEAVKLQPNHPVARYNLGTALLAQNRVREAATEFAEAVRLKPEYAEALTGWGRALTQAGDFAGALARFEKALQLRPDAFTCYYAGIAQLMNQQPQDAVARFRKALELRPDWPMALNELGWTLATHPDSAVRNGEEAVRLAESSCQVTGGQDLKALATLDAAYAEANRFEDAIATASKVRDLASSRGQAQVASAADSRLAEYRSRRPYRQPPSL
jgi:protein O-mannosyl-transferase